MTLKDENICKVCKRRNKCYTREFGCQNFELDLEEHDADIRRQVIEKFRAYLKSVIPCEMPQEIWDMGVDNTCDRMLKGEQND